MWLVTESEEGQKVEEAGGKRSRWERVQWQSESTQETERIAWQDQSPFEICNHEFKVSPVSTFMAFLNPLLVFQVQARNMCRAAFNHVKILLEGRLLMPWFKYIFRILELEETLRVFFYYLWEKIHFITQFLKLGELVSKCQIHLLLDSANYFLKEHCKLETITCFFQSSLKIKIGQRRKI